jgi:hypothetical protein
MEDVNGHTDERLLVTLRTDARNVDNEKFVGIQNALYCLHGCKDCLRHKLTEGASQSSPASMF